MAAPKPRPPARRAPATPAVPAPVPDDAADALSVAAACLGVPTAHLLAARVDGERVIAVTVEGRKEERALP